jgi:hypothetical protein
MGFSLNWFAIPGVPIGEAAKMFGLEPTDEIDDSYDFKCGAAVSDKNWTIIAFNRMRGDYPTEAIMRQYSSGRQVLCVYIVESVMVQVAALWEDGREIWNISHDSQKGGRNLEARGHLPDCYAGVHARRFKEQDDEDAGQAMCDFICEIPLEVAARITGFKHDETNLMFSVLTNVKEHTPKPGTFLHRLFGK